MTESERRLVQFVEDAEFGLMDEFAVRFERTVKAIELSGIASASSTGEGRDVLNEALHTEAIRVLRSLIGPVLKGRNRVAVLVDNLDKAWDKKSDLEAASQLLLGLLSAVGKVSTEYQKEDFWRDQVSLTLATFLRSDIYAYLQRAAREPDKLNKVLVDWTDANLLLRVIEERFLAARSVGTDPSELWEKFICPQVSGRNIRDYLAWRILPRPRDMVYIFNAATIAAVNARRERIEEDDFLAAEGNYSQFAFEALLVENGITILELEEVLLEFAGGPAELERATAVDRIRAVVQDEERAASVLARLEAVSFFGMRTSEHRVVYPDVGPQRKRDVALARRYAERQGKPEKLMIHPAYRPYLGIAD
jgi:hypothetical protein